MQSSDKMNFHTIVSVLTLVLGLVLMIGKIYFDSEPGLIPLVMVTIGAGWFFVSRRRSGAERK